MWHFSLLYFFKEKGTPKLNFLIVGGQDRKDIPEFQNKHMIYMIFQKGSDNRLKAQTL